MAASSTAVAVPNSNTNRLKMLLHHPVDVWSVKEKLSLASAVKRSGDQNWVSASRSIKPFVEERRPPDWISQKNCALQYADLLDKVETPKRKRGDQGHVESPTDQIVRKMTIERIEELKRMVQQEQQEYKRVKYDRDAVKAGQFDDKIKEKWEECLAETKAREEKEVEIERKATEDTAARAAAAAAMKAALKPVVPGQKSPKKPQQLKLKIPSAITSSLDDSTQDSALSESISVDVMTDEEFINTPSGTPSCTPKPTPPASPFLSSILHKIPEGDGTSVDMKKENESHIMLKTESHVSAIDEAETNASIIATQAKIPSEDFTIKTETVSVSTPSSGVSTLTKLLVNPINAHSVASKHPITQVKASENTIKMEAPKKSAAVKDKKLIPQSKSTEKEGLKTIVDEKEKAVSKTKHVASSSSLASLSSSSLSSSMQTTAAHSTTTTSVDTSSSSNIKVQSSPLSGKTTDEDSRDALVSSNAEEVSDVIKLEVDDADDKTANDLSFLSKTADDVSAIDDSLSIKDEPLSPTSSISSKISEADQKTSRRKSGRGGYRSRSARRNIRSIRKSRGDGKKDGEGDSSDDETVPESDDALLNKQQPPTSSLFIESIPNSPASTSQCSDTEDERVYKTWKKSIMLVWRAAANHKYANVFLHHVTNDIAPGYDSVVFRPKDLHTIKKHIEMGVIKTTAEFQREVMLMFTNAIMYNNSDHNVFKMAHEMYDDVMQHIETIYTVQEQRSMANKNFFQFVSTQLMLQSTEMKSSLRGARRSEASDKEEESKKRRTSTDHDTGGKSKKRKTRADD